MERTQYLWIVVLFTMIPHKTICTNQPEYRKTIYDAYITGDMQKWKEVIEQMEKTTDLPLPIRLELLSYYYGYTGFLVGSKQREEAKKYISNGEKLIETILAEDPLNATAYACKGSFIGYKMEMAKVKAIILGPESMRCIHKAYQLDPENIQAITDKGNMLFYAPAIAGGNRKKAIAYLEKAIEKTEQTQLTVNNWFYLNTLVLLARYCEATGEKERAVIVYRKILSIEPGFTWVKEELYPDILKK